MGHTKGNVIDDIPLWTLVWTYWGFIYAIITAHVRRCIFWMCTALGYLQEDPAFLSAKVNEPLGKKAPSLCELSGSLPPQSYLHVRVNLPC